jgi:hypothetical protein
VIETANPVAIAVEDSWESAFNRVRSTGRSRAHAEEAQLQKRDQESHPLAEENPRLVRIRRIAIAENGTWRSPKKLRIASPRELNTAWSCASRERAKHASNR